MPARGLGLFLKRPGFPQQFLAVMQDDLLQTRGCPNPATQALFLHGTVSGKTAFLHVKSHQGQSGSRGKSRGRPRPRVEGSCTKPPPGLPLPPVRVLEHLIRGALPSALWRRKARWWGSGMETTWALGSYHLHLWFLFLAEQSSSWGLTSPEEGWNLSPWQ